MALDALEIDLKVMEQAAITKKNCCKDLVDIVKGQDELNLRSFDDLDFSQQQFISTFVYSYINCTRNNTIFQSKF